MHELSLCKMMFEIINEHVATLDCQRIKKIHLEVGELMAIDEAALCFGFEVLAQGTIAEQACLVITLIEGLATCDVCHKTMRVKHYYASCESCDHFPLDLIQGEELRIKSMEVQ